VAADFDRPPELCVQSLNGVRNRYDDAGADVWLGSTRS
jgi:hypothetical protein